MQILYIHVHRPYVCEQKFQTNYENKIKDIKPIQKLT